MIVTAQRRAENIKDVPMAIATLKGEKLDVLTASGQDIRFLSGRTPSVQVESDYGRSFPRFYIRGMGNTDFDLNASQPVGLVFDDVVQENPMLKGFPVFDVDQIEVLRGPQGTLFGRNSPAGVIKFDSAKPVIGKSEGYFMHGIGNYSVRNLEGAYNLPISDTMAGASRCKASTAATASTTAVRAHRPPISKATTTMRRACSCWSSRAPISAPCSTSTHATMTAAPPCSAPISSSRAPTTWSTTSTTAPTRPTAATSSASRPRAAASA
ncbi:TonB-dependent receptor plug domain-containing protein [Massilia sp. B-10]|nr:TonB-dependent receptor plug domain-containing protein [Massilia sp. B-10]